MCAVHMAQSHIPSHTHSHALLCNKPEKPCSTQGQEKGWWAYIAIKIMIYILNLWVKK